MPLNCVKHNSMISVHLISEQACRAPAAAGLLQIMGKAAAARQQDSCCRSRADHAATDVQALNVGHPERFRLWSASQTRWVA